MLQTFRAGTHLDSRGKSWTITEADMAATAKAYDRKKHEAPLLVGHDESKPNKGLVKNCFARGSELWVEPHKINPEFSEQVNKGELPKLSAAFYLPDNPNNPVPGVYYLRHVGAVQIPAVKGMEDPQFSEDEGSILIEFSDPQFADWSDSMVVTLFSSLRDHLIEKEGLDVAEKVLPQANLDALRYDAMNDKEENDSPPVGTLNYSEAEPDPRKQELDRREAELNQREEALRNAEFSEFLNSTELRKKIKPGERAKLLGVMKTLQGSSQVIAFGEGDADSISPLEAFKQSLRDRPDIIEFDEVAGGEVPNQKDLTAKEIADKAIAFQEAEGKAGRYVDAAQAVQFVMKEMQ